MQEIEGDPFADVTFTGGDPLYQAEAFTELARRIRGETRKTIWCYTGYLFEQTLREERFRHLIDEIDVLVDGLFIQSLRDEDLPFRGSTNQRIIDVRRSLQENRAVLWERI